MRVTVRLNEMRLFEEGVLERVEEYSDHRCYLRVILCTALGITSWL